MGIEDTFREAQACHVRGQLVQAEERYRQVLALEPRAVGALEGLGVLLFQQGNAPLAVEFFSRAVPLNPRSARLRANLGEALRSVKQLEGAHEHLSAAAALDPTLAQTWNSLGLLAADQKQHGDAEARFREAIRLNPRVMAARVNLANALHGLGRLDEAIAELRIVIEAEPNNVLALTNLGQMLCDRRPKDLAQAESLCRLAVGLAPSLASALNGLGKVLRLRGNLDEARACHERALVKSPRDPTPHHHLGQLSLEHGRLAEASHHFLAGRAKSPGNSLFHLDIGELLVASSRSAEARPHFERALECDPTNAEAHHGLGRVLMEEGRLDEAEAAFREALRLDAALARSWSAIARIQAERGDLELSCGSARKALAIRPEIAEPYLRLAVNQRGRLADSEEQSLERLIHEPHLPADAKSHLHFSLAIVRDRRGLYAEAASLFDKAHEIQAAWRAARGQFYDAARQSRFNERMIAAFPPGSLDQNRPRSDLAARPVFIVGLPRSGTSMIEQMLASHNAVWGAGELPDLHNILRGLPQLAGCPQTAPVELLRNLDPSIAEIMARQYADRLAAIAPEGAARIVDKMQDNIRLLGLIGLILPGARVILCSREPPRRRRILPPSRLHRQHLDRRLAIHRTTVCRLPAHRGPLAACSARGLARGPVRRLRTRPRGQRTPHDRIPGT